MKTAKLVRSLRDCALVLIASTLSASLARAEQFVLFDVTFTFTEADADNAKPSKSHYYVKGAMLNPNRPRDWTAPVDYRNGTVHIRAEVIEKPTGGEPTTWTLCYIPNKGKGNGYGCTGTNLYRETGVYEKDVSMKSFWENESIVWTEGIKQMDLVIKDASGGNGHAHRRKDFEKFFPTRMRITMVQVSAGSKYDPSLVPNLPPKAPDAPKSKNRAGEERQDNGLSMKLCWCPAGTFTMGSPPSEPERRGDEGPVEVTLSQGFWIGKYEVTQAEWTKITGATIEQQRDKVIPATPREKQEIKDLLGELPVLYGVGPDHPVYYVNFPEAVEFARTLTAQERGAGRLPVGWEYRLPTEAQWEYACRAGTITATAFGNHLGSNDANCNGDFPYGGAPNGPYLEKTRAVGHYRANGWGIQDMHGNVAEWCRDHNSDKVARGVDPDRGAGTSLQVKRGGSWFSFPRDCRSAYREKIPSDSRRDYLGFRVILAEKRVDAQN